MKKSKGYYKAKWKAIPKHTKVFLIAMSSFIALAVIILLVLSFVDFRNGGAVFSGYFTFWHWFKHEGFPFFVVLAIVIIALGFYVWLRVKNGGVKK